MIAVDTNILIYAHRRDSPYHSAAAKRLRQLAEGPAAWAIPWSCLHEFFSIVTNPRIYVPPSTPQEAVRQIGLWLESSSLTLLSESERHWSELRETISAGHIIGARIHDARIAAICLQHGVQEIWTADRDFSRFPGLHAVNPLIA